MGASGTAPKILSNTRSAPARNRKTHAKRTEKPFLFLPFSSISDGDSRLVKGLRTTGTAKNFFAPSLPINSTLAPRKPEPCAAADASAARPWWAQRLRWKQATWALLHGCGDRTNIEQNRSLSTNCLFFSKRETRRCFRGNLGGSRWAMGAKPIGRTSIDLGGEEPARDRECYRQGGRQPPAEVPMERSDQQSSAPSGASDSPARKGKAFILGFWGVRYQVSYVSRSIDFYTGHLGFNLEHKVLPAFAQVSHGNLKLILGGPGASGSRAISNGRRQEGRQAAAGADRPGRQLRRHKVDDNLRLHDRRNGRPVVPPAGRSQRTQRFNRALPPDDRQDHDGSEVEIGRAHRPARRRGSRSLQSRRDSFSGSRRSSGRGANRRRAGLRPLLRGESLGQREQR